ncbi:DUF892 family protein [Mucilaginibacter celer]|uniref:DUF892 family protein n=1 Tax=Mucilaginibacter celer TaxID=2305508 RepID=A0A494VJG9_9SPHI|nr:DUF892 family protein [Mucilaginibacter celer]AYL95167.1 DUF892 family protein [Mucilaginibacter celer]
MISLSRSSILNASFRNIFVAQIKILYNSKQQLIGYLPLLLNDCYYMPLKHAIAEILEDISKNAHTLRNIIKLLSEDPEYKYCLGTSSLVYEAYSQVKLKKYNIWEIDMTVVYYLSAMMSQQLGVANTVLLITKEATYSPFAQSIEEIADTTSENCTLLNHLATEIVKYAGKLYEVDTV